MVFQNINYSETMTILDYKMEDGHLVGKALKEILSIKDKIKRMQMLLQFWML